MQRYLKLCMYPIFEMKVQIAISEYVTKSKEDVSKPFQHVPLKNSQFAMYLGRIG